MNFRKNLIFFTFFLFFSQFSLFSCSVNINNNTNQAILVIDVNHYISSIIPAQTELKAFGDPNMRAHFYVSTSQGNIYHPLKEVVQTACTGNHMININLDEILQSPSDSAIQLKNIPIRVSNFVNGENFPNRMHKPEDKSSAELMDHESMKASFADKEQEKLLLADYAHTGIPFKANFVRQYNEPGDRFAPEPLEDHEPFNATKTDNQQVQESSVTAWLPQSDLQ